MSGSIAAWLILVLSAIYLAASIQRWIKARKQDDQSARKGCFRAASVGAIGILFAVAVILVTGGQPSNQLSAKASKPRPDPCDDYARAYVTVHDHIRAQLRSPASADFPILDYKATKSGPCRITIRSYVDAQNGFGATIRSYYTAVMEHRLGSWKLVTLKVK